MDTESEIGKVVDAKISKYISYNNGSISRRTFLKRQLQIRLDIMKPSYYNIR